MHKDILSVKEKKDFQKKQKTTGEFFLFVFLSLILCLLCFFIYLVKNSSFEKVKVEALQSSIEESFSRKHSFFQEIYPSNQANHIIIYYRTKIEKDFPFSKIKMDIFNDEVLIFLPIDSLFKTTSFEFNPKSKLFIKQIEGLLKSKFLEDKYIVDFILFEDLGKNQDFPIFKHLTTERLEALKATIESIAADKKSYSIGIEKGNDNFIKLHFRKRRTLQ
jgi:hypothetical protein